MKKFIFLSILLGVSPFFNSCAPAYVAVQPTYTEVVVPPQPSKTHIWAGNNWIWNQQNRAYSPRNGYWIQAKPGRSFVPGHWKTNRRGHYWVGNRWQ